jgi:hypothetical protein
LAIAQTNADSSRNRDPARATLVTSNLPFDEWTSVFGSGRLTGVLLDRLTHHVHILEMNGESFRLATARKVQRRTGHAPTATAKTTSEGDADPKLQIAAARVEPASPRSARLDARGNAKLRGFAALFS